MKTVTVTVHAQTTSDVRFAMREVARLIDEEGEIEGHDETVGGDYDFFVQDDEED